VMSAEQVERTFAFTIGFAIAACWSLISGTIVVLGLAAWALQSTKIIAESLTQL
jgi:hypothetical protein